MHPSPATLWGLTRAARPPAPEFDAPQPHRRVLAAPGRTVNLAALETGTALRAGPEAWAGRAVGIDVTDQLSAALAVLELDGVARRLMLYPPGLAAEHRPLIWDEAEIDATLTDADIDPGLDPRTGPRPAMGPTEWILLTSGTSGRPKLVRHTLASLTAAARDAGPATGVWSTFYDIRRYGGLAILLRALVGGTSMVLSSDAESVSAFLTRAGASAVTHMSGTPTHWRRAMMSGNHHAIAPRTVRLSGEIADQATLDQLRRAYPTAQVTHAFASTEAGVAFEVTDGKAGFPAKWLDREAVCLRPVCLRIVEGTLRIRSARTATGYLAGPPLRDAEGFVDTGDVVVMEHGRCHYAGRASGVVNVGGAKVHPEEVEAVLNAHPEIRQSLVTARRNPITGALVCADIVAANPVADPFALRERVLEFCRTALPPHKVPVVLRIVPNLAITAAGKLARA